MSKPRTAQDLQDEFMDAIRHLVDYWAKPEIAPDYTVRDRLSGLAHSILTTIDGYSMSFPCSLDLVCRPNSEDKDFSISQGEDWIEDGTVINENDLLNDILYKRGVWRNE